jgi:hypothetical protein
MELQWSESLRSLKLQLAHGSKMLSVGGIPIEVRLAGSPVSKSISFHGHPLSIAL